MKDYIVTQYRRTFHMEDGRVYTILLRSMDGKVWGYALLVSNKPNGSLVEGKVQLGPLEKVAQEAEAALYQHYSLS